VTWDPSKYRLPPLIGEPVPPQRVGASPSGPGAPRRPAAHPAQPPRTRVCGRDCHTSERKQARIAAACCALAITFIMIVVLVWHPGGAAPRNTQAPPWGGGSSRIYPHNPGVGAAVIAGEAKGAARVAGGVARWGFRGARIARGGGIYIPGTGGFHVFHFGL